MNFLRFFGKPWVARLCFILALLFYVGLPQLCWKTYLQEMEREEKKQTLEERKRTSDEYYAFIKSKLAAANKKISEGHEYRPRDYFHDLKDIHSKEKELGWSGGDFDELGEIIKSKLRSSKADKQYEKEIEEAREDYKRFIDPAEKDREKIHAYLVQLGWVGIMSWFLLFYLKLMPFALLLLTSWIHQRQEEEEGFLWPKPSRFLLILLFYPLIISYVCFKYLEKKEQHYLAEAEFRRTKQNLFGSLSEEEIRRLKEFRDNNLTLSAWREHLSSLGLKPKHSLAAAMAVTLLIALVPVLAQAETKDKAKEILPKVALEQIVQNYSARMNIDGDNSCFHLQKDGSGQDYQAQGCIFELINFEPQIIVVFLLLQKTILRLKEVCRQIFHVPLFGYLCSDSGNFNLTTG